MRRAGSLLLAGLAIAAPAVAGPPAPADAGAIPLERAVGDGFLGPLLDAPTWRPGRPELVFVRRRFPVGEALVALDAATGLERTLLALSTVDRVAGRRDGPPMQGIGRAGAPRFLWPAKNGDVVVVARRGDLYRVDLPTGAVARLTRTRASISDVRVSDDGEALCFARDFDLWAVVRRGGEWTEVRLTTDGSDEVRNAGLDWVYPEELDCRTGAWWSPTGDRVAFLRLEQAGVRRFPIVDYRSRDPKVERQPYPLPGERNPTARVGVVGLDGAPPVWMDLGADRDVYVPWAAWTPDGARLLVPVIDRRQRRLTLLRCDPATGRSTSFLEERAEDPGWIDPPEPPRFVEGRDAFVWRRPRDGWWRLVLVSWTRDAVESRALTPDALDVDHFHGVHAGTGAVYFASGGADPTRQSVWRTDLSGSAPVEVPGEPGWRRADFDDSFGWFLETRSSSSVPARQTLRRADGAPVRVLADAGTAELRALALDPPVLGRVERPDGVVLRTRLRRPARFDPARRYPVVVSVYGGPGARTVRDDWPSLFDALLAQDGFAVLSVDNRGSSGCGRAFETSVCRRLGRLELEDQVAAVEDLKRQPWVDGARVGVWGWSYGGTMACLAMTRAPETFRAGVAVAPVTDWRLYDSVYTERYLGLPAENAEGYRDGSPIHHVAGLRGALLLCHGLDDDNVHAQNTIQMAGALVRAKKPFDLMLYPGGGHGLGGVRVDVFRRIREHFRRHLTPDGAR